MKVHGPSPDATTEPGEWIPPAGLPDQFIRLIARRAEELGINSVPLTHLLKNQKHANRETRQAAADVVERVYNADNGWKPFAEYTHGQVLDQVLAEIWACFEGEAPAAERTGRQPLSSAWISIDPVVRKAIEKLEEQGPIKPNKSEIQRQLNDEGAEGVKYPSSMVGPKWKPFNRLFDLRANGDYEAFDRALRAIKQG
ncbi:MAG TPA: hypothetical protein VMP01_01120 [Pirellulaceae bacterium]|nr:hypothetical protein [Pirellulaceae bacterium]